MLFCILLHILIYSPLSQKCAFHHFTCTTGIVYVIAHLISLLAPTAVSPAIKTANNVMDQIPMTALIVQRNCIYTMVNVFLIVQMALIMKKRLTSVKVCFSIQRQRSEVILISNSLPEDIDVPLVWMQQIN